eukprot:CCRYP_015920-RA/>CCRYP_015920-RA protein AED:0.42 eAED:0.42 QI:13/1/1/1/0/0/2/233/110
MGFIGFLAFLSPILSEEKLSQPHQLPLLCHFDHALHLYSNGLTPQTRGNFISSNVSLKYSARPHCGIISLDECPAQEVSISVANTATCKDCKEKLSKFHFFQMMLFLCRD